MVFDARIHKRRFAAQHAITDVGTHVGSHVGTHVGTHVNAHGPATAPLAATQPSAVTPWLVRPQASTDSTRTLSVRALQLNPAGAVDALAVARGEVAFSRALQRTRELATAGTRVVWAFDLDNTLYDTRARTLAIGVDFDSAHGTHYFADISTDDLTRIGRDGAAQAESFAMPAHHAEAFTALWDREFWNPARVMHDVDIADVHARALRVLAAGGTLRYVTGRAEHWTDAASGAARSFRADSLVRLLRSGLPATDDALVLKPAPGGDTAAFKRATLVQLEREPNTVVAGFVTDTLRELVAMQHVDTIPCFWVRTTFELARNQLSPPWVYALPLVM